ncbi:AraC family transcriptional regulator [Paraburkholderia agricolaris]|uniref:AraC family transcriptional regulator n=1 Tax=Paraburkholderia agricolaris TaxID=2152888 RepID=A0ABW8ZU34_9BURK
MIRIDPPEASGDSASSLVDSIEAQAGAPSEYVVRTAGNEVIAARWRHDASTVNIQDTSIATMVLHLGGSTSVERWKPATRKLDRGSRIGTVTLLNPHELSNWRMPEAVDVFHIYMPRSSLALEARCEDLNISFKDVFSKRDEWLCRFSHLILDYAETQLAPGGIGDSLFLEQLRNSVARYITLHYSLQSATSAQKKMESRVAWLSPSITKRVTRWLEEHYAEDIRLKDMAAIACLSDSYFLKAFRDTVGQTPYHYLKTIRLNAARALLRTSNLPVSKIATSCGYKSGSHFCVEFGRETGMSPSIFRRQSNR